MLDCAYYNDRLDSIHLRAGFDAELASFIDAINAFDSVVIAVLAKAYSETGSINAAQEALGDYIQKGSGSLVSGIGNVYKMIFNMGTWTLKMIRKMMVFAVKGFKGTVGGAVKELEEIGDERVKQLQDKRVGTGISMKACLLMIDIAQAHMFVPNIKVKGGEILKVKQAYVTEFNKKMDSSNKGYAKIKMNFDLVTKPGTDKFNTLADTGGDSAKKLIGAGKALLAAEKVMKERLDDIRKTVPETKSIIDNLQKKGYKDKFMNGANTVPVLKAAYQAAILANDLKELKRMEDAYTDMIYTVFKKSKKYVASK